MVTTEEAQFVNSLTKRKREEKHDGKSEPDPKIQRKPDSKVRELVQINYLPEDKVSDERLDSLMDEIKRFAATYETESNKMRRINIEKKVDQSKRDWSENHQHSITDCTFHKCAEAENGLYGNIDTDQAGSLFKRRYESR